MKNRRQFLYVTAGLSGALGLGVARWLASDGSIPSNIPPPFNDGSLEVATRTGLALGSDVSMKALHVDHTVAAAAVDAAFDELERVEQLMSIYRPESQLSRLNRDKLLENPHPYFIEVLQAACEMSRRSGGAFDITVQPLWELFAAHGKTQLPDDSTIELVRQRVDWRRVEVNPERIRLHGEGTAITLNGIAQGFAADKAMGAFRDHGIEQGLINAGEIGTLGCNRDGMPWTVGIQHPRHDDAFLSLTRLAGRCLATSGDYATTFSDDFGSHHIFNPRTGRSPTELASVSIAAETAMQADALSTAVFVLGTERGTALVRSIAGADALFVGKDGRSLATDGFVLET